MQIGGILTKKQQEELFNLFKQINEYNYKDNFYVYPKNNKYHIYDKLITSDKLLHNFNISVEELFKQHSRYVTTKNSELEAKAFIDGMRCSQENRLEETIMIHEIEHGENTQQKQHVISQAYMRRFSFDPDRDKNKQRVYTLDKKGNITPRKIANLNYIRGYNTGYIESKFAELENIASCSIDSIIQDSFTEQDIKEQDINKIKLLTSYFIANQPRTRSLFYKLITKGKESEKEEQGTICMTQIIYQLLLKWDSMIHRNKKEDIQSQMYIISDNPVHINDIKITTALYISPEMYVLQTIQEIEGIEEVEEMQKYIQEKYTEEMQKIQKSKNKVIYQHFPKDLSAIENPSILSVPEDATIIFPLNPHTAIYFYQNEEQKEKIINDKSIIQKANLLQIENLNEYTISQSKNILEKLHKKQCNL